LLTACAKNQTDFTQAPDIKVDHSIIERLADNPLDEQVMAVIPPAVEDIEALLALPAMAYKLNCLVLHYLILAKPRPLDTDANKFILAGAYEKWTPIEGEPKRYLLFQML